ncbi:hypothetical protein [Candidatus Uabimicrobium sp. HlEnr_7]|uniref:hypothetical protein n=1 Tax=Candidatus Uabimicrobium helgolandensis TaxID=3095367 RepID=UPI003557EE7A
MDIFILVLIILLFATIFAPSDQQKQNKQSKEGKKGKLNNLQKLQKIASICHEEKTISYLQYQQIKTVCQKNLKALINDEPIEIVKNNLVNKKITQNIPQTEQEPNSRSSNLIQTVPDSQIETVPDSQIEQKTAQAQVSDSQIEMVLEMALETVPDSQIEQKIAQAQVPDLPDLETVPDSQIETVPDSQIEQEIVQVKTVPDSQIEQKIVQAQVPDLETVPDSQIEQKIAQAQVPDSQIETVPDSQIEQKIAQAQVSDSQIEMVLETVPDSQIEQKIAQAQVPDLETVPDSQIKTVPDSQIEQKIVQAQVPDSQIETVPDSQIETVPDSQIETEIEIETVPDSQIEQEIVQAQVPDSQIKTVSDSQIETEIAIETVPDSQIEQEIVQAHSSHSLSQYVGNLKEKRQKTFDSEKLLYQEETIPKVKVSTDKVKKPEESKTINNSSSRFINFKDNILLFLGLFLIMAGEVFLIANFWPDLSGSMQILSSYFLVFSSSVFFFFIGHITVHKLRVTGGGFFIYLLSLLLMPCTFVVTLYIPSLFWQMGVFIVTCITFTAIGDVVGNFIDSNHGKGIVRCFVFMSSAHLLFASSFYSIWFLIAYSSIVVYGYRFRIVEKSTSFSFIMTSLFLSFVTIFSLAGHWLYNLYNLDNAIHFYLCAPILGLYAYFPIMLDRKSLKSHLPLQALPLLGALFCVFALTVATSNIYTLFFCVALSCGLFSLYAQFFQKTYLSFIAFILSGIGYFLLPEVVIQFTQNTWLNSLSQTLGQLPISYQVLTFIPYLIAICFLGNFFRQGKSQHLASLQLWFVLISVGLICLIKIGSGDLVIAIISLPVYTLMYFFATKYLQLPFLYYLVFITISIWGYDISTYFTNIVSIQTYSVLFIANLWLFTAMILPQRKSYIRKCLIDVYTLLIFFCVFSQVYSAWNLNAWQSIGSSLLVSGLLISICVLIYQQEWLWFPCFIVSSAGIYLIVSTQSTLYSLAYAFAIWGYGLTFISYVMKFLFEKPSKARDRIMRAKKRNSESLMKPLWYLIPSALLISLSILIYEKAFLQPSLAVMLTFYSMSILALTMPFLLRFSSNLTWLAQVLFIFFALPICVNLWSYGLIFFCVGSISFAYIAFLLTDISALYTGALAIVFSVYRIGIHFNFSYEILLIFCAFLALLYAILCFFVKNKHCNRCFQTYSFIMGAMSIAGIATILVESFHSSASLIIAAIITTTWAFLHYLRHRENGVVFIFFICIAATTTLFCEYFFPQMWQVHALALCGCAFLWLRLQRLLLAPNKAFITYSAILTMVIYGLSSQVLFGKWQLDLLAILALGLAILYSHLIAFQMRSKMFMWIFAFLIHQLSFAMLLFNNIIAFPHILTYFVSGIFFVLWVARYNNVKELYDYSSFVLHTITITAIITRLFPDLSFSSWVLSSYLPIVISSISYLYIYVRTRSNMTLSFLLASGILCTTFFVDFLQYSLIYYGVAFSYLATCYTMLHFFKRKHKVIGYIANILVIFASGIFVYFYAHAFYNYQQLYRYHLILASGLAMLSISFALKHYILRTAVYSYLSIIYYYILLFACFIQIYCDEQWYNLALLGGVAITLCLYKVITTFLSKDYRDKNSAVVDSAIVVFIIFILSYLGSFHNRYSFLQSEHMWTSIVAWSLSYYLLYANIAVRRNKIIEHFSAALGGIVFTSWALVTSLFTTSSLPCCDWALYAIFCIFIAHYSRKTSYLYWGILFSCASIAISLIYFWQIASIFTLFIAACTALACSLFFNSMWYRLCTFSLLITSSILFICYTPLQMITSVDFSLLAIVFSAAACGFAVNRNYKNTQDGVYFCTTLTVTMLITLSILPQCTAMMVFTGILSGLICISACFYIAGQQSGLLSYYMGLLLWALIPFFIYANTNWINFIHPYHCAYIFIALLPALSTLFIKQQRLQRAIGNFSLVAALSILVWFITSTYTIAQFPMYIMYIATTALVATMYTPRQQQPFFSTNNLQSFASTLDLAVVIISLYTFTFTTQTMWISALILSARHSIMYARTQTSESLLRVLIFLLTGLLLFSSAWLSTIFWPLIAITTLAFLSYTPQNILKYLKIDHAQMRQVIELMIRHVVTISALCGAAIFVISATHANDYVELLVAQNRILWFITGIIAVLSLKLQKPQTFSNFLVVTSAMLTMSLSTPIAHFFPQNNPIPTIEWVLLAIVFNLHKTTRSYSFICLCIAIIGTEFDYTNAMTPIVLFLSTCYFVMRTLKSNSEQQKMWLNFSVASSISFFYLGVLYFYAEDRAQMWELFSLATAFTSIAVFAMHRYLHNENKKLLIHISMLLNTVAIVEVLQVFSLKVPILPLVCLVGSTFLLGNKTKKAFYYYCSQILIITLYLSMQHYSEWLYFLRGYETHVLLILAMSFFQIGSLSKERQELNAFIKFSYILPLAVFAYSPWELQTHGSILYLLFAAHFGFIYRYSKHTWQLLTALVFLDVALYHYWQVRAIVDPQFYGIPLGITLLAFAEFHREEIDKKYFGWLRFCGIVFIYGSSLTQVFLQLQNPFYALLLAGISFVGIIVGLLLRNIFYVYFATAFLVLDILVYIIKFGVDHGILQGVLLVSAGIVVLGIAIASQFKKNKIE